MEKHNGETLYKLLQEESLLSESRLSLRLNTLSDNTDINQSVITTAMLCGCGIGINNISGEKDPSAVILSNLPTYMMNESVTGHDSFIKSYNNPKCITVGELRDLFKAGIFKKDYDYYLMIITGKDSHQQAIDDSFSIINNFMIAVVDDNLPNAVFLESKSYTEPADFDAEEVE